MSDVQTVYPCHICKDTMIDYGFGVSYTFPREYPPISPGKLYWDPLLTAAATMFPSKMPTRQLVDCYNCKGSGVVTERRSVSDRRHGDRRLTPDFWNGRETGPYEDIEDSAGGPGER